MNAVTGIAAGEADIVVAGGVENMSAAPYLLPNGTRKGIKMGSFQVEDHMIKDALTDAFDNIHMGITAENIADKHHISRESQDALCLASQEKAIQAVDAGLFDEEIVPLEVKVGRETLTFARDEYPNRKTNPEKLATLRPAFKRGQRHRRQRLRHQRRRRLPAAGQRGRGEGHEPEASGRNRRHRPGRRGPQGDGPGPGARHPQGAEKGRMKLSDMELIELNEAFAAQSLGVVKELSEEHGMSEEDIMARTNLFGGAIALGHPVGASARASWSPCCMA